MNEEEEKLASFVFGAVNDYSAGTERSQQSAAFKVGISDLGHCQNKTKLMILQTPPSDERDYIDAFLGTAIGEDAEKAVAAKWSGMKRGVEVTVTLEGDQGTYNLTGHPDLINDDIVIDLKTRKELETVRRTGPKRQQRFQRHLYALGAFQMGLIPSLEGYKTANVWIDRSGAEKQPHAEIDLFSWDVIAEATQWLDDVVYAVRYNHEAQKEPSREFCERYCEFYSICRAQDVDVEGLLTDEEVLAAIEMHREAGELMSAAKLMQNQAKIILKGIEGSTGKDAVRWVHVNGGSVEYQREPYMRLSISRIKPKKGTK